MLTLNLRTRDPARARYLAGQITALADNFVAEARSMGLTPQQTHQIFAQAFTAHLDKLERIAIRERAERGYEPEQERSADQQMGWVYRLLETRGHGAELDERVVSQMWAAGLDEASIVEVAAMVDDMRRKRFVPERRERLQAVVEAQGGEPSPMALRMAEHQIYRARAAACFQVARRHDGVRVEDDALLAQILATRLEQRPSVNQPDLHAKAPPYVPVPARTSTMAQQQSHEASDAEHLRASKPSSPAVVPDLASHFLVELGETLIAKKSKARTKKRHGTLRRANRLSRPFGYSRSF